MTYAPDKKGFLEILILGVWKRAKVLMTVDQRAARFADRRDLKHA